MRDIVFTPMAKLRFDGSRKYLETARAGTQLQFEQDVLSSLRYLARNPYLARAIGPNGLRGWTLSKWHKLIVIRFDDINLTIVTIQDTRQEQTE